MALTGVDIFFFTIIGMTCLLSIIAAIRGEWENVGAVVFCGIALIFLFAMMMGPAK